MRIDMFLKTIGMFKSRQAAKQACDEGLVMLNGIKAKPSKEIKPGDVIVLNLKFRKKVIKVLSIPPKNLSRKDRDKYFQLLEDVKLKPQDEPGFWELLEGEEV